MTTFYLHFSMRTYNVRTVIFLNRHQKGILDGANISLESLTLCRMQEIFTQTDYTAILAMTYQYCSGNNMLTKYGFTQTVLEDVPMPYTSPDADNMLLPLNVKNTSLDAVCPDNDTIIIWEVDDANPDDTNNMLQLNIRKILTAMLRVHTYETVKNTKQFEICILYLPKFVNEKKGSNL